MGYGKQSRVRDIFSDPAARSVAVKHVPALDCSPALEHMGFLQFSAVVQHATGTDPATLEAMWDELARLDGAPRAQADAPYIEPVSGYEPDSVRPGSARVAVAGDREQWGITELVIDGPSHGKIGRAHV